MGIWLGPRGRSGIEAGDFLYSGNYLFKSDGHGNWEMALLDGRAATLQFLKNPGKVDLFLVAGGQTAKYYNGTPQNAQYGPSHGGIGGNGGETLTMRGVQLSTGTAYSVSIGGSDQNTTLSGGGLNLIAVGGNGISGGEGGVATQDGPTHAPTVSDGVYAYGEASDTLMFTEEEFPGHLFGAPGGGGGSMLYVNQSNNSAGALGGESNGPAHEYGKGGVYNPYERNGSSGYPRHGQGGGGPYFWFTGSVSRYGDGTDAALGSGGSGVMFIRNAR